MSTHTITSDQSSIGTKVLYGNLIVMLITIIVFSSLYIFLFESPNVEEYKTFSRDCAKFYFGIIPVISLGLYKGFKKA